MPDPRAGGAVPRPPGSPLSHFRMEHTLPCLHPPNQTKGTAFAAGDGVSGSAILLPREWPRQVGAAHREGAHCSEESPKSFLLPLLAPCHNTFGDALASQMAPKTSRRVHQGAKHPSLCSPSSGILLPLPWHTHFSTCQKPTHTSLQTSH